MASSGELNTSNGYIKYRIDVSVNSQSLTDNTSNVRVSVFFYRTNAGYTTYGSGTLYCRIDGTLYSAPITTSQKITNSGIYLFDKWLNISHNIDGTKNLTVTAWIELSAPLNSSEQGFTLSLATIPRASQPTLSKSNFEFGETITVFTNRVSNIFTHTVRFWFGNVQEIIATNVIDSISWTVPESLMSQIVAAGSGIGSIYVDTYNGNSYIGTKSASFTADIPSYVAPVINNVFVSEAASGIPERAGYVKSYSKLKVITDAVGVYDSTISLYSVTIDDLVYSGQEITSNVLTTSGIKSVSVTVTDSRGKSTTKTQTIIVNDYATPNIIVFDVSRCNESGTLDEQGEYAKVIYRAEITNLNAANEKHFAVKYKKTSESQYNTYNVSSENYTVSGDIIIPAESGSSYNFVFEATDSFGTVSIAKNLQTAYTIFNVKTNGKGFAFGKVSEKDGLEINMPLYDRFSQIISNGLAEYNAEHEIDPNETSSHLILTETHTPNNEGYFYILTLFFMGKDKLNNKTQIAVPFISSLDQDKRTIYLRQNVSGEWNEWVQI